MKFSGNNAFGEMADRMRQIQRRELPAFYDSVLVNMGADVAIEARDQLIGRTTPLPSVGGFDAWEPLKPATIEQKQHEGLGRGGDPRSMLYATGALQQSISYHVNKGLKRVQIGSDSPYAEVHEYGAPSKNIPPRPFLGTAMFLTMERQYPKMQRQFCRVLDSKRPYGR